MVTLDLENCDEVASTYSPNNPMAGGDIGAAAARRQGEVAENLYPFKLVSLLSDPAVGRLTVDRCMMMGPNVWGVTVPGIGVSYFWRFCLQMLNYVSVRWVNAIWTVLERTQTTPAGERPSSLRVNRPASSVSNYSDGGGSASTHYVPRPSHPIQEWDRHLLPSPFAGPSRLIYTTDDAVIQTTGGFAAALTQRGSRRLAVGGDHRGRSHRRVASEGDLSESAGEFLLATHDAPLTAESAREVRPSSRDFIFARGISPPPLTSPPVYRPPSGAEQPLIPDIFAGANSPSDSLPVYHSPALDRTTPAPVYQTIEGVTRERFSPTATHQVYSSTTTMQTVLEAAPTVVAQGQTSIYIAQQDNVPARPAQTFTSTLSVYDVRHPTTAEASLDDSARGSRTAVEGLIYPAEHVSAQESLAYAPHQLASPFMTAEDRSAVRPVSAQGSISSYTSAPPPVPSRDSRYITDRVTPSSRQATPVRYQLYDPSVPSFSDRAETECETGQPPAPAISASELAGSYRSTLLTHSPRSSEYSTAPPPPISRSTSAGMLSFRSPAQDQAETETHVSEPDSDADLIADLERRSSAGTEASRSLPRRPRVYAASEYNTARTQLNDHPLLKGESETSLYFTARDTANFTTASWPSESTYTTVPEALPDCVSTTTSSTAAAGLRSYHTAKTSQTPSRDVSPSERPTLSVSTAQSVASTAKIKRVPVPPLPSPSFPSSVDGSSLPSLYDASTPVPVEVQSTDINRLLVSGLPSRKRS